MSFADQVTDTEALCAAVLAIACDMAHATPPDQADQAGQASPAEQAAQAAS
jgi:hypothetical protein